MQIVLIDESLNFGKNIIYYFQLIPVFGAKEKTMRTQAEILAKIKEIEPFLKHKDPHYVQYKILVYKLEWHNAIHFLEPQYRTDEQKKKWKDTSKQDDSIILMEIIEKLDLAAMYYHEYDKTACMGIAFGLLTYVWLMGNKYDKILTVLYREFFAEYAVFNCFRGVFEGISNEFGIDWDRFKSRYAIQNNRIKNY